jgi:hypothetical protein
MRWLHDGTRESLGLHVDGRLVQVALLRRQGGQIRVVALKEATLIEPLDLGQAEEIGEEIEEQVDAGDILGLEEEPVPQVEETPQPEGEEGEAQPPESNSEVLYALLGEFPAQKRTFAISLMEGSVSFTDFQDDFGLKGKRLKKKLLEETRKEEETDDDIPISDRHAYLETERGTLLSMFHEDSLEIVALLDELKSFVGRVMIGLIDPLEITLMNLVRLTYPADDDDSVTAVVHVGQGFSRVVFMKKGEYLALPQTINEGSDSPQVLNTVYRRILLQQDTSNIPEIGRVLLSGECQDLEVMPFFADRLPDSEVEYCAFPGIDLIGLEEEEQSSISRFAIPIGMAWKALLSRDAACYRTNFLPRARRRQQNPLELAWHSILLLVLLLVSFPLLGLLNQRQEKGIEQLNRDIGLVEQQIQDFALYSQDVEDIFAKIGDYQRSLVLVDSLTANQIIWSAKLRQWAAIFAEIDNIWLERFSTNEGGVDVQGNWEAQDLPPPRKIFMYGKATQRSRASEIAARLGDGQIHSLVRSQIRKKTVYEFDLTVPITAPESLETEP